MIKKIIKKIKETQWKYKKWGSDVRIQGEAIIDDSVKIIKSIIYVDPNSKLEISCGCILEGIVLNVTGGGRMRIGESSIIKRERNTYSEYIVDSGSAIISDHCLLKMQRMWVRFGGTLSIGSYTNVNYGSEIRCDEDVCIGDYCRLSYNIRIWDTNTHSQLGIEERRKRTRVYYPFFGKELQRPKTKPVHIGSDCWLGENVSILKGTTLGDHVTIAYNTLVSNTSIPDEKTVFNKHEVDIR